MGMWASLGLISIIEIIWTESGWSQQPYNPDLNSPGIRTEVPWASCFFFSWVSSLMPGVFPGHAPGQELEGSGDGGGVAVLISKLRRNPE